MNYFVASLLAGLLCSSAVRAPEMPDSVLRGPIKTHIHTEEEYAVLGGG